MDNPVNIRDAGELIDWFYQINPCGNTDRSDKDLDSADFYLLRYGPELTVETLRKMVKGDTDSYQTLSDTRANFQKSVKSKSIEIGVKRTYWDQEITQLKNEAESAYDKLLEDRAQEALQNGSIESVVIRELEVEAESETQKQFASLSANASVLRKHTYHAHLIRLIKPHVDIVSREKFVASMLAGAEVPDQQISPVLNPVAPISANKITSARHDYSLGRQSNMATTVLAKVVEYHIDKLRHDKCWMKITSDHFMGGEPVKVFLLPSNVHYDGKKLFQNNILDHRFVKNNPVGTEVIVNDVKKYGNNAVRTNYVGTINAESKYGAGLVSLSTHEVGHNKNVVRVAHLWERHAIAAKEIGKVAKRFRVGQEDILKCAAWKGYQIRVVKQGQIGWMTPARVWNSKEARTVNYEDLNRDLAKVNKQFSKAIDSGAQIEIALFTAVKVAPFVKIFENIENSLTRADVVVGSVGGQPTYSKGQVAVNGVLEIQNDTTWKTSVVRAYLPAPNDSGQSHIHEQIRTADGKPANLHERLRLSPLGELSKKKPENAISGSLRSQIAMQV